MPSDDSNAELPPRWRRYLRFWRSDVDADVRDEIAFHIDGLVAQQVAAGVREAEARTMAEQRFGSADDIGRTMRALASQRETTMRRTEWIETVLHDARYGVRQLLKTPAFTAVAVLTLGLGIGANGAIFSVVYSVLLHPLPFANADRVVTLWERWTPWAGQQMNLSFGNYDVWRREATRFEALGATRWTGSLTLTGSGEPTPITEIRASASFWKAMYIAPVVGSYYGETDDREGAPHVAVLSYALWQSRFAGDRGIVGRAITLNRTPYTVAAVAPPGYVSEPPAERIWTPLAPAATQLADHGDHELKVYGLPRRGGTEQSALAQLTQIETRLAKQYPNNFFDGGIIAHPLIEDLVGDTRGILYVLLGAVGLVLLIACGNVANLLIARATVRRPEIAIRSALGASRARIVSQLLVESLVLSIAGAGVGLAIAVAGISFLVTSPVQIARLQDATLNGPVLAFTVILAVLCAVVFGLVPALRAARLDLQQTLRDGGREGRGAVRDGVRRGLIIGELCLAQVLLVGAGLLIRSAAAVHNVPPGFDPGNLLLTSVSLPGSRYQTTPRIDAAFSQMQTAIAAIPGVRAVARAQVAPIYSGGWDWPAFREGSNGHDDGAVDTQMRAVSAGYFTALGTRLLVGRDIAKTDRVDATPVAIVSRALARRLFGDANPVGKRIGNGSPAKDPQWRQIVGVVEDIHANGLSQDAPLMMYMPGAQWVNGGQTFLVRTEVPPLTLVPNVRRAVASVDPLLALSGVMTMDDAVERNLALPHFATWLITLLGITGLVLAVVGVYGVIGYFVSQRTHEFGVRMALGAGAPAVRWMVVRQGLVLGVVGVGAGLVVSFFTARLLGVFLFGVTAHDPLTYVTVAALLVSVGAVASYLPARRATRIDPLEALRRA
jgi:predicted permease